VHRIFTIFAKIRKNMLMTAHYTSKHGLVSKRPEELYMAFCDMRNFSQLAGDKVKADVKADYDSLSIEVQGFRIGVKIDERLPYSLIRVISTESPVEFVAALHFDNSEVPGKTDFSVVLDANLNFMMKSMLGSKIQQGLDKAVDTLVDISEGRMPNMPEGFGR